MYIFSIVLMIKKKLEPFHIVFVQGKGIQTTYWLHGRDGYSRPLPRPKAADIDGLSES